MGAGCMIIRGVPSFIRSGFGVADVLFGLTLLVVLL